MENITNIFVAFRDGTGKYGKTGTYVIELANGTITNPNGWQHFLLIREGDVNEWVGSHSSSFSWIANEYQIRKPTEKEVEWFLACRAEDKLVKEPIKKEVKLYPIF